LYLILTFITLLIVPAVNLSGIISGRMEERLAEMGVRKAFGASKRTLLNQVLVENFVLTFCGSVLGLLLAWGIVRWGGLWMLDALGFSNASEVNMEDFMATGEMLFAPVVFGCTLLFCLLINTLSAFLPAWLSLRKPIVESMNQKK
jgi:putative ABC transport system permease protein